MALRFYGKGGSQTDSCPSVHADDTDGSLVIVGTLIEDPDVLTEIQRHSHIDPHERAVRVPRELRKALREALGEHDPDLG
ncbi:hypothetical protein F5972_08235 [Microbispora cellulosiformans]|uniref:Uncharacterized protein n=1 Tax=Microbispora cellulosiformans TaxID=2614688 RepID=A0A5J5K588_9ACTN|nr:hypothetical protein [Microbispora cellulosiformans]KAA9379632.1 hypothetical protein F5972_08235 [Microbispora cellulosiformans]